MSTGNDPTRRIPKKIGSSDEIWRGYTLDDLMVGAMPFIVAVVVTAYFLPPNMTQYGYILSGFALFVGAVIIYLTPDHLTASEWVNSYSKFYRRPKKIRNIKYNFGNVREQEDFPESGFLELEERTQDMVDIKKIYKNRDAVMRTDDKLVGAVKVEPANMALTTPQRWQANVNAFADFVNNSVEWPFQIYSTTTDFPIDNFVEQRRRRLEDEDVQDNPVFRELIEYWLDWYPEELELRGTHLREYYILIPVGREDVTGGEREERSVGEKLGGIPVLGWFFGSSEGLTESQIKSRMFNELDERLGLVENQGIRNIDGCKAMRADSAELARILIDYWTSEGDYGDYDQVIRSKPVVTGSPDLRDPEEIREDEEDAGSEDEVEETPEESEEEDGDEEEGCGGFWIFGGSGGDEEEQEMNDEEEGSERDVDEWSDDEWGDAEEYQEALQADDDEFIETVLDDIEELQKGALAPGEMEFEPSAAKLGKEWTKTMWAEGYPDQPSNGFLERLFTQPGIESDVSIHVDPRDTTKAQLELKNRVGTLEAEYERKKERRDVDARGVQKDLEDAEEMYDVVRNTPTGVFDVSMYVTVRSENRESLDSVSDQTRATLKRAPANITPVTAVRRQDEALRSNSPVCLDMMNKKAAMMGGAIGAMFPFSSSTLIEESGVEYGVHAMNGSPLIADRFRRDVGYNALVIGNIGSGKSFATKLNLIRTAAQDEDSILVMLDPLKGFVGVNEALGGERVIVGGNVGLNPLELRETPDHVLDETGGELDPFADKLKDVMSFFESYFDMRDNPLEERRGTLENAVKQAYHRNGIYRDPETHSNQSPTIPDVIDVLKHMAEDPDEYSLSESEREREKIERNAAELLIGLEPFTEGGEFENLSKPTEVDIKGSKVVYLDLQQQETRGGTGLMMQLLFNAVYEMAKERVGKRVIFAIDEARYIMKDASNLAFLEQAVRHSRHYDLSIQFITQTVDEFFAQDESEAIADNCSIKLLQRIEGMDEELGDELDLTPQQQNYVRNAMAGDEEAGYSEALLGVAGEGWYPIHVRANDLETAIIDYDPDEAVDGEMGRTVGKRIENVLSDRSDTGY
ncbi:MAG: VirB4 family type IV secretion system protein [Halobacteria archaeon]